MAIFDAYNISIKTSKCSTLTPAASLAIHDRMPVILPGDDIEKWIDPVSKPDEIIKNAMTDMVLEKIIA